MTEKWKVIKKFVWVVELDSISSERIYLRTKFLLEILTEYNRTAMLSKTSRRVILN